MRPRLLNVAAVVSLLIGVAAGVAWVWHRDRGGSIQWSAAPTGPLVLLLSNDGELSGAVAEMTGQQVPSGFEFARVTRPRMSSTIADAPTNVDVGRFRAGYSSRENAVAATVPCWSVLIASAVLPAVALARRRHARPGLCPGCGYDLRATPARCPECGAVLSLPSVTTPA